jgi:hypothetical protein
MHSTQPSHLVVQILLPVIGRQVPPAAEAAEQGAEGQGAQAVEEDGEDGCVGGGQHVEDCVCM